MKPSLLRTMKPSLLRTMKPSLPRTRKPSLLQRNRFPAVMAVSNCQTCSKKYLRVFRERLMKIIFLKGANQSETIPLETNEIIPAENNETIPVEKEPLPSGHGRFKLSDLIQKILESIRRTFNKITLLLKVTINRRLSLSSKKKPSLPRTMKPSLSRTMKPSFPRTMKPSLWRTMKPSLLRSMKPSLPRTMKPSMLRTMKPSLPRTMKPSLLRSNRFPAVLAVSKCQICSRKYLRVFRQRLIKLLFC